MLVKRLLLATSILAATTAFWKGHQGGGPTPPTPVSMTCSAATVYTDTPTNTLVCDPSIVMSDGSTFVGTLGISNDDAGRFSLSTTAANGVLQVASSLSSVGGTTRTPAITATQNSVTIPLTVNVPVTTAIPTGITFTPASAVVLDNAPSGTLLSTITVAMNSGNPFTGSLNLTNSAGGRVTISGSTFVTTTTPLPIGSLTAAASATENSTTVGPVNLPITVNDHTAQVTLVTANLVKTDASTISANFIPPLTYQGFRKGDLPCAQPGFAGCPAQQCPSMQLSGGTVLSYSWGGQVYWSDGSLKGARFLPRIPNSLSGAAGTTLAILYKTNGTCPSASARTLTEVYAAGISTSVVGADQLSGTWAANLTNDAFNRKQTVFLDGDVGKGFTVVTDFTQSGAAHGQLEDWNYVLALTDSGGGLYGFRHLSRISQPWYDVNSPAKDFRTFTSMAVNWTGGGGGTYNPLQAYAPITVSGFEAGQPAAPTLSTTLGGSLALRTYFVKIFYIFPGPINAAPSPEATQIVPLNSLLVVQSPPSVPNATGYKIGIATSTNAETIQTTSAIAIGTNWTEPTSGLIAGTAMPSSCSAYPGRLIMSGTPFPRGTPFRLTSTGTLPTNAVALTTYWYGVDTIASHLFLGNLPTSSCTINIQDAGSGTVTATVLGQSMQFGNTFTAGQNGQYLFIQGAGSRASEALVVWRPDKAYWAKTKLLPTFDVSQTDNQQADPGNWFPTANAGIQYQLDATGESLHIGPIPGQYSPHFLNWNAAQDKVIRYGGLAAGQLNYDFRNSTTFTPPVVDGNSYTGFPADLSATLVWRPSNGASGVSGFTAPATHGAAFGQAWLAGVYNTVTSDHIPGFTYYPYLMTGEPQFLDLLMAQVTEGIIQNLAANRNSASPAGKGIVWVNPTLPRAGAWATRDAGNLSTIMPAVDEDSGHSYKTWANAQSSNQPTWLLAFLTSQNAWMTSTGFFAVAGSNASWQTSYSMYALAYLAGANEDTNALAILQRHANWMEHARTMPANNNGLFNVINFYYRAHVNESAGPNYVYISDDSQWGWENSGPTYTWDTTTDFITVTQNTQPWTAADGDVFIPVDSHWYGSCAVPGGLTIETPYFAVNTSLVSANKYKFQVSATKGGSPIHLTTTGSCGTRTVFQQAVAPAATGFNSDTGVSTGYGANNRGSLRWMQYLGVTGLTNVMTDMNSRTAGVTFPGSGGTSKYAMTATP